MRLADTIRTIPDYPKKGILFRDITTLLGDAKAFRHAVDELVQPWAGTKIDKVAGVEARGFILGRRGRASIVGRLRADPQEGQAAAHDRLDPLFARIRARPHGDARGCGNSRGTGDPGRRSDRDRGNGGGGDQAPARMGAEVVAACFVIDLPDLGGAAKLEALGVPVRSLVSFSGH